MTAPTRVVLAFLPLAIYFFVLGTWQSGRRARVVSGGQDFGMLAFGMGGLVAFGPVGQFLVGALFPRPGFAAWVAVASLVGLIGLLGAIPARKRMIVYHVIPSQPDEDEAGESRLDASVRRAFERVAGEVTRTLHGFENRSRRRGVTMEVGKRLQTAVIQAYGDAPESLIAALKPALIEEMEEGTPGISRLAGIWFGLCLGTMLAIPILATAAAHSKS